MLGRYSSGKYLDEVYGADMYDRAIEGYIFCIEHQRPAGAIGRMAHANRDSFRSARSICRSPQTVRTWT